MFRQIFQIFNPMGCCVCVFGSGFYIYMQILWPDTIMLCASLTTRLTTRWFFGGLFKKKIKTGALAVSMATIPEFPEFFKIISGQIKSDGRRHTRCVHPVVAIFHFFFAFKIYTNRIMNLKKWKRSKLWKKEGTQRRKFLIFPKNFIRNAKEMG